MIRTVLKRINNTYTAAFLLLSFMVLLSACGRDEKAVITELGVDVSGGVLLGCFSQRRRN